MRIELVEPFLESDPRPRGAKATMIVMHATAGGSKDGAVETLRDRRLSYHYIIDKKGTIWKCAPYARMARHAGNSYGPNEAARGVSRVQNPKTWKFVAGTSVNRYTIGISFVNRDAGADPYTDAQHAAAVELIKTLKAENDSLEWITTHAIVSPKRKVDPNGYDIERLARDVGLLLWKP